MPNADLSSERYYYKQEGQPETLERYPAAMQISMALVGVMCASRLSDGMWTHRGVVSWRALLAHGGVPGWLL